MKCPRCEEETKQVKNGKNKSGTQAYLCRHCKKSYTPKPKYRAYNDEVRELAMKAYYSGVSARGVAKIFGFNKSNVSNWIKKTARDLRSIYHILELDELYWYAGRKGTSETRENCYIIPLVSRSPRQIAAIDAAFDKSPERIQALVDNAPPAEHYATDGYLAYIDVVYPGKHIRNIANKNDTFTVESVNADLRHYIPTLRRRSRCFPRSLEMLKAVLEVFADAYNKFGEAKEHFKQHRTSGELPFSILDFL